MAASKGMKRKTNPSKVHSAPAKAQNLSTKGLGPLLKDYTGDFSDINFTQAKEYCKELGLPGKYTVGHQDFIERLRTHYGGFKTSVGTVESAADQHESGDEEEDVEPVIDDGLEPEDEPAEGSKELIGASKATNTRKPAPTPKSTESTARGTSAAGGKRPKEITPPPRSTRVLSRASHYRILELKKMLISLRNLARIEEDPALNTFLDLLSEVYVAMHNIAPDALSPDNLQSASSLTEAW